MAHPRQNIREAIKALLEAAPGLAGRVFTTRTRPTSVAELPCVIIYALSETAEQVTSQGDLRRELAVGIEIRALASGDLDDALDDLALVVETTLAEQPDLLTLAENSVLAATAIGLDGEGESRQAVATLTYNITYFTES